MGPVESLLEPPYQIGDRWRLCSGFCSREVGKALYCLGEHLEAYLEGHLEGRYRQRVPSHGDSLFEGL